MNDCALVFLCFVNGTLRLYISHTSVQKNYYFLYLLNISTSFGTVLHGIVISIARYILFLLLLHPIIQPRNKTIHRSMQ